MMGSGVRVPSAAPTNLKLIGNFLFWPFAYSYTHNSVYAGALGLLPASESKVGGQGVFVSLFPRVGWIRCVASPHSFHGIGF